MPKLKNEDQPWTANYPALQRWLDAHGARCVAQLPLGNVRSPQAYLETWMVNGRVFVVQVFAERKGWNIYTAYPGNETTDTLIDAEQRLGLEPIETKEDPASGSKIKVRHGAVWVPAIVTGFQKDPNGKERDFIVADRLVRCNACGRERNSPPDGALGRRFRCCSLECCREMEWRCALSMTNKPYRPDPETPLGKRVAEMEAERPPTTKGDDRE